MNAREWADREETLSKREQFWRKRAELAESRLKAASDLIESVEYRVAHSLDRLETLRILHEWIGAVKP